MCFLAALCAAPAFAQTPIKNAAVPKLIHLDFKAEVQVDGVLTNITPDSSLAPALQAMVSKRVSEWRYQSAIWQGKPIARSISQQIVAEVVPVSTGGFSLRIKEVTGVLVPDVANDVTGGVKMFPPMYPMEVRKHGVQGTLIYALRVDTQGKLSEIELLSPEKPSRWIRMLDDASRDAFQQSTMTVTVEGTPIDCRAIIPMQFVLGETSSLDAPDLSPYRARFTDACPAVPKLLTQVAGTVL